MLFGPYLQWTVVPVRLDHLLFPILGGGIFLLSWWRYQRLPLPKLLYPFIGFMVIAAIATVIALYAGPFNIRMVRFLAGIENHVRFFLIFVIVAFLRHQGTVDLPQVWQVLFLPR